MARTRPTLEMDYVINVVASAFDLQSLPVLERERLAQALAVLQGTALAVNLREGFADTLDRNGDVREATFRQTAMYRVDKSHYPEIDVRATFRALPRS